MPPVRILIAASPGVGHLLPLLPVARAARARGHEVVIAAGASLAGIAAGAGFQFAAIGPASIEQAAAAFPEINALTGRRRAVLTFKAVFCGPIATGMAEGIDDIVARWQPDAIIREDLEFGSSLVAERRGIPLATIQATAWRPRMRELAVEPLNLLRAQLGLPEDPELHALHGSIFFTTRPASLRNPDDPMPTPTVELRPIADDRRSDDVGADPFPPRNGRSRVAATLGTVSSGQIGVLRQIAEGAALAGADVVVALGADPSTFGQAPSGVDVREYVPMSELLPAADVVAFHGGSGTMLAAAAAGVPMLIVPLGADQPDNGDRCVAAGIARVVGLDEVSPEAVRASIVVLLSDPEYRQRAAAVAAEIAGMPGPEVAMEQIEQLA